MALNSNNLKRYIQACELLKDEIDLAIHDHRFRREKGRLLYTIDFSEIFAYVLPSVMYRDFILFPDAFDDKNEIADAIALQQLVLKSIFFDLPENQKPILLPPYLLEFRTFVQELRSNYFEEQVNHAIQVFNSFGSPVFNGKPGQKQPKHANERS